MKRNVLLITCCFLFLGESLMAQDSGKYGLPSRKDYDRWSIGLNFGQTFLFGDVLDDPDKNNNALKSMPFAPSFGLHVTNQLSHSVALRLSGAYGQFKAGPNRERIDSDFAMFDAEYDSPMIETALEGIYTFGNISHLKRNKRFHFFVSVGCRCLQFRR